MVTDAIRDRVINAYITGEYTVRGVAAKYDMSKSTVHGILKRAAAAGNEEVARVIQMNTEARAIRGGEATKRRYEVTGVRSSN